MGYQLQVHWIEPGRAPGWLVIGEFETKGGAVGLMEERMMVPAYAKFEYRIVYCRSMDVYKLSDEEFAKRFG